mgnify:CR=1 FL=1
METKRSEVDLETVVRRIRDEELDLQPEFQRGEVWDLPRRQRLIDSILRDWYVPAVHFVRDEDGEETVLDGQQRLAAIRDFFDGRFRVNGKIEPLDDSISDLDGLKFDSLPAKFQKKLQRYSLPVVVLWDHEPQEPSELFFRLNQSYNLTPPEKRNALYGPARDQIRDLVRELVSEGLLTQASVGFSNGRLAYDDIIARTCLALEWQDLTRHINNNVVEQFYREREFSGQVLGTVREGGRVLMKQIESVNDRIRFNKGTLFSWLIFCAVAASVNSQLPPQLLSNFETSRRAAKSNPEQVVPQLRGALATYSDRASYRVTDVSSVQLRDLVLALFLDWSAGEVRPELAPLVADLASKDVASQQGLLAAFIADRAWGKPLTRGLREAG